MKIRELLALEPQEIEYDLSILFGFYYNHLPESNGGNDVYGEIKQPKDNRRAEIRIFKHHNFDCRRFWRLAAIYLDGKPVMIIQNAGREGDDYRERFILDKTALIKLVIYVDTILAGEEKSELDVKVWDLDDEPEELIEFYGNSIKDVDFERYM